MKPLLNGSASFLCALTILTAGAAVAENYPTRSIAIHGAARRRVKSRDMGF
jgi:hypothetical protein